MTTISYVKPPQAQLKDDVALATLNAGNKYTLSLKNQSGSNWTFYVYQQIPNQDTTDLFSLAWMSTPIENNGDVTFIWETDYGFVWGTEIVDGSEVVFQEGGKQSADLKNANTTVFSTEPDPNLSSPVAGAPEGTLGINNSPDIPNDSKYFDGISMSGTATFITLAKPNSEFIIKPTPTYWIAVGTNVQVGTVLDITKIFQNQSLTFPANVYAQTWIFNEDNTWENVP